jgi:hypothetical protein
MCRNIKTLFNFDPPASDEEVRVATARSFDVSAKMTYTIAIIASDQPAKPAKG